MMPISVSLFGCKYIHFLRNKAILGKDFSIIYSFYALSFFFVLKIIEVFYVFRVDKLNVLVLTFVGHLCL